MSEKPTIYERNAAAAELQARAVFVISRHLHNIVGALVLIAIALFIIAFVLAW